MENKEIKTPEVEEKKKLSYEQLAALADHMGRQIREKNEEIANLNNFNLFKRVDYLFKVVENSPKFPEEFVTICSKEIVDLLTLPDNVETEEVKEK